MKLLLAVCLMAATIGCANRAAQAPIPGSVNQFDSDTYLSLITTYNIIEGAKSALAAGQFPPSIAGNVKKAVNDLTRAYNVADASYLIYHTSAVAGGATAAQQANVNVALAGMQASTTNLTAVKGN